jgi:NitT/TauT family transport system substrate-binding protein
MAIADPSAAAAAVKAMVPEIDVDVARAQFAVSIPLMINDISKRDGAGAFEPALLAKTWKWTAEAQNMPLDKLDPETAVDRSFMSK